MLFLFALVQHPLLDKTLYTWFNETVAYVTIVGLPLGREATPSLSHTTVRRSGHSALKVGQPNKSRNADTRTIFKAIRLACACDNNLDAVQPVGVIANASHRHLQESQRKSLHRITHRNLCLATKRGPSTTKRASQMLMEVLTLFILYVRSETPPKALPGQDDEGV